MRLLKQVHHVAVICSDYEVSKDFYCRLLGFELIGEYYRSERDSWKADLALSGHYVIELFSFPSPPQRVTHPEACGLRHLAFAVEDIKQARDYLMEQGIGCEAIRCDPYTNRLFTFFCDPDGLPLELYEQ